MTRKVKWGIIAPGNIAEQFATGINSTTNGEIYAVCSRNIDNALSFMAKYGGEKAYNNEEELAADQQVDIIYIANPHPFHKDSALTCLRSGKAVLCEKPLTVNAADSKLLIDTAREQNVFLMEAMWTRFLPVIAKTRELIADNTIGEIRMLNANFGFTTAFDPESRLLNPALAGGALLDVGIYPLALTSMILGKPAKMQSVACLGRTGVDEQFSLNMQFPGGAIASISAAVQTQLSQDAWIYGTTGAIHLHAPWWHGTTLSLYRQSPELENSLGEEEIISLKYKSNGYNCEAEAVAELILNGAKESDIMPLAESLQLAEIMDAARAEWGLRYPFE